MSINWVMLSADNTFIALPNERSLYSSPTRTQFSLASTNTFPGTQPFSRTCASGIIYITNQRIVYIPSQKQSQFESFSSPIENLHDTHVSAPFFGPNVWTAVVQPVLNGGIPATPSAVELKLTFKEGGAFDFHSTFEKVREKYMQARGDGLGVENVHLDDLPTYHTSTTAPTSTVHPPPPQPPQQHPTVDAPPGYDEAQQRP